MNGEEWLIMVNRGIIMDNYGITLYPAKKFMKLGIPATVSSSLQFVENQRTKWKFRAEKIIYKWGIITLLMNAITNWLVVSTPLKNMKVSWDHYSQYMET